MQGWSSGGRASRAVLARALLVAVRLGRNLVRRGSPSTATTPRSATATRPRSFRCYPVTWCAADAGCRGRSRCGATLLSSLMFGAALCLLYRITERRFDEGMARRTVLYLSVFPLTFVFSLPYAESLFLLCVLGAFALTWHGRWWWGLRGGGAGGTGTAGRNRAGAGAGVAALPRARAVGGGLPAAAAAAGGRGPGLLRLPVLAHRRSDGPLPRAGARLGPGRVGAAGGAGEDDLGRVHRRPPALPRCTSRSRCFGAGSGTTPGAA